MFKINPVLLVLTFIANVNCANILFYFIITGHSHISSLWPLMVTMGERGHNVTLLTAFEVKQTSPKVNIIYASKAYDLMKDRWDKGADQIRERMNGAEGILWIYIHDLAIEVCAKLLEDPIAHDILYKSQFDLVILDGTVNECGLGLAYYQYKCPAIQYSPIPILPSYFDNYGIPVESSTVPETQLRLTGSHHMSFYDKLMSTIQPLRWWFYEKYRYHPKLSTVFKERLNLTVLPVMEHAMANTKLVFTNTHYSRDFAHSRPPLFVAIGGLHIAEDRNFLKHDLEKFVTNPASNGFIYVSFGTAVRISKIHLETRQKIFAALGNFSNFQFVFKWEGEQPSPGSYPSNIYFAEWLPQQDLYAHKNIRGAITNGGSNSIHEAIHFGVPMIIFPIFADQDYNAYSMAAKGMAIVMEISDFSQGELEHSLKKLVSDTSFQERVKAASSLFRDRPMKPLDTAVWWVEYVLRHPESNDLMPSAVSQTWYERRQLHVWYLLFFILTVFLVILALTMYTLLYSICRFFTSSNIMLNTDNSKIKSN